jgi:hypothetical protein
MDLRSHRPALETFSRKLLARFVALVLWEPPESLRSFIEIVSVCIVEKMEKELPGAIRKNRLDGLEKRAIRWLERSFWEDIRSHPDDPLDKRTLRLKKLFDSTARIPQRQGDGEFFAVSVFIEYDSLLKRLEPIFNRRPPEIKHLPKEQAQVHAATLEGGQFYGLGRRRLSILQAIQEKRYQRWKKQRLEQVSQVLAIDFWPQGQEVWFTEDALTDPEMTARTAALRILGAKLGAKMPLGDDAVWKLVKQGKQILPPPILEKMEVAFATVDNGQSWQFLKQLASLK